MTSAIIVAAGSSRRMGFDKLNAELAGMPVLAHALLAFQRCGEVDEIVVVTSPDKVSAVETMARNFGISILKAVVEGGAERHLSVWNGIQAADPEAEWIAVHDGARPLISNEAIRRCLAAARETRAAVLARPVSDTLKRVEAGGQQVAGSVSRENLWAMETPQIFASGLLRSAYEAILKSGQAVTDEVSAVEALGEPVFLVENPDPNLKITVPADLALAEALLAAREEI